MHEQAGTAYLTLRLIHIVGSMLLLGGLVLALSLKLSADRTNDPARASGMHRALRRADSVVVGPAALLAFAGGYSAIRFLGGRIGQHWFSIWGLILLFVALGFWYFGTRRLNVRLAEEADACLANRQPLSPAYARASVAWLAFTGLAALALVVAAFVMVFRAQLGIA